MKTAWLGWVVLPVVLLPACQPAPPAPSIASFTATPDSLPPGGGNVALSWQVGNASSLSIDQGVGAVSGSSKSLAVAATTTFTLTAANAAGTTATKSVTVTVASAPPAPAIEAFSANPSNLPFGGGNTQLSWQTSNATTVSINQGVGEVSGNSVGVAVAATTTFTLTAANAAGLSVTRDLTVVVADPPSQTLYALTDGNQILTLDSSNPAQPLGSVGISGVAAGDTLRAIDVRPQNGLLYALGVNAASGTFRLYLLNPDGGNAVAVGAAGVLVGGDGATPVGVSAADLDLEFNPAVDRARVVGGGLSFRMNPNTGALVDGDLGGASGSVPGVNPDGAINGGTTSVQAAAYTNNAANATATTLYTLGEASLFIQNPPNAGTQTAPKPLALGGSPLAVAGPVGLDIAPGVNVASSNAPAPSGLAYASLTRGGIAGVYAIDLPTGNAFLAGNFSGAVAIRDIAVAIPPSSANVIGLSGAGTSLVRFAAATPGTSSSVALSGVGSSEALAALSLRPATGQLFGLGVNAAANTATLYLLDPQTGAATPVGMPGQIAFVSSSAAVVDLPPVSAGYGMDFNPTVDRVRVVTGTGLNFRLNPTTGGPVDGDPAAGVNPDGFINGLPSGSTGVTAASHSNSQAGATVTTLYSIDSASRVLFIQGLPNAGTLTSGQGITLNGSSLAFTAVNGFDLPSSVSASTSGGPASGEGYLALTVGGAVNLYRINLGSGALTLVGAAPSLRSLAVSP